MNENQNQIPCPACLGQGVPSAFMPSWHYLQNGKCSECEGTGFMEDDFNGWTCSCGSVVMDDIEKHYKAVHHLKKGNCPKCGTAGLVYPDGESFGCHCQE